MESPATYMVVLSSTTIRIGAYIFLRWVRSLERRMTLNLLTMSADTWTPCATSRPPLSRAVRNSFRFCLPVSGMASCSWSYTKLRQFIQWHN